MTDRTASQSAEHLDRWTNLGVELPQGFTDAIDVFQAVKRVQAGRLGYEAGSVTPENAADKVREYAQKSGYLRCIPGRISVLQDAKNRMLEHVAWPVLWAAADTVPVIIEQLQPRLEEHAERYYAAVQKLPEELSSEALFDAGASAVDAYAVAEQEATELTQFASFVASTSFTHQHVGKVDPVLHILRPDTYEQLAALDEAKMDAGRPGSSPRLQAVNPVFLAAARLGVPFIINTLQECAEIRAQLENEYQEQWRDKLKLA